MALYHQHGFKKEKQGMKSGDGSIDREDRFYR